MEQWTQAELEAIAKDPDLYLSIPNLNGMIHESLWIWIVQAGNELYARGYSGTKARWYQAAKREGRGHITVGGVEKDVRFEFPDDPETIDLVDEGYRKKYADSPRLEPVIRSQAREATVRLVPVG
ncbi:hypothetical protein NRIC_27510 [Enterococcus florum]|uniref:DUF2255 domain-containing protein n=1 Tax=Enterococcus florum TaxID=2480627 RepID=A0A4P5PA84_9ENTE|nr:DUF2255 family protein [Enterococcus florum]GCF94860.1 hypothetical protein NRIC_27510 [Enterococcus florum]